MAGHQNTKGGYAALFHVFTTKPHHLRRHFLSPFAPATIRIGRA